MPYTAPGVTPLSGTPTTTTTADGYTYPEIDLLGADVPIGGTSYIDVTDADAYFLNSFNAATWTAISPADQAVALAEATRWLETLCWKGEKCNPAQALAWPRKIEGTRCCAAATCSVIPPAVIQAASELALALHQNKTAIVGGGGSGGAIKRAQLGGLSVEYFEGGAGSASKYGATAPLVLQRFPWIGDLLGECYLEGNFGRSRIIARVRS